jgi:hypothetical protein
VPLHPETGRHLARRLRSNLPCGGKTPDQLIEYVNIQGTSYVGLPEEDLFGWKFPRSLAQKDVDHDGTDPNYPNLEGCWAARLYHRPEPWSHH